MLPAVTCNIHKGTSCFVIDNLGKYTYPGAFLVSISGHMATSASMPAVREGCYKNFATSRDSCFPSWFGWICEDTTFLKQLNISMLVQITHSISLFALTKMKQTGCIYFTYQTSHYLLDISYEWESENCHSSTLEQLFCHISKKRNGRLSQMSKIFNTP